MDNKKTKFFKSKLYELRQITWTRPKKLANSVGIVLSFTMFFTLAIFLVDTLVSYILNLILNLL